MKCPNCGAINQDTDAFCVNCGRDMMTTVLQGSKEGSRNCVSCGRSIPWSAALCPYCGKDYRIQAYQPVQEERLSTGVRFLLYALSLLIPIAGFIVGAVYYTRPEAEYKHVGKICLILGLVAILFTVGLSALIYVLVLGYGGIQYPTPSADYGKSVVLGGERIQILAITRADIEWDDVGIMLADGMYGSIIWYTQTADFDGGYPAPVSYGTQFLGTLSVSLAVTDLAGNGFVDAGDYFVVSADPGFSSETIYSAVLIYEHTGEQIGTGITFVG